MRRDRYYNAYVHLGLALGVAGRIDEMEQALGTGAKLARRRKNWHEFAEIREIVGQLHRSCSGDSRRRQPCCGQADKGNAFRPEREQTRRMS